MLKITLITPPDHFENLNPSILFMHLTESEQDAVSKWLSTLDQDTDLNIYFYQGELDVSWLLHAASVSDVSYINLDNLQGPGLLLSSYILAKSKCHYSTKNQNYVSLYSYINKNRVDGAIQFLERVLRGHRQ